jgi:hypothetical protein
MDPGDRRPPEEAQDRRVRWASEDADRAESHDAETLDARIARLAERSGEVVASHPEPRALHAGDALPESSNARDAREADEAEIDRELGDR